MGKISEGARLIKEEADRPVSTDDLRSQAQRTTSEIAARPLNTTAELQYLPDARLALSVAPALDDRTARLRYAGVIVQWRRIEKDSSPLSAATETATRAVSSATETVAEGASKVADAAKSAGLSITTILLLVIGLTLLVKK